MKEDDLIRIIETLVKLTNSHCDRISNLQDRLLKLEKELYEYKRMGEQMAHTDGCT